MRKIYCYLVLCLIYIQCGDLDRNNPLDPKNPGSQVERGILVEIFVNDGTGFEYCNYALDAIEKLSGREEYKNNLLILEYHLTNRQANWYDDYAKDEFNERYYEYAPLTSQRGIPDAMFNGLMQRVQGASLEKVEDRYLEAAQKFLGTRAFFRIEADKKIFDNNITLDIVVARLGRTDAVDVDLCVVLYEDLGLPRHRFVVRKILQRQTIPAIKHGKIQSFSFSDQLPRVENNNQLYALVFLQELRGSSKEVYQAAKF